MYIYIYVYVYITGDMTAFELHSLLCGVHSLSDENQRLGLPRVNP